MLTAHLHSPLQKQQTNNENMHGSMVELEFSLLIVNINFLKVKLFNNILYSYRPVFILLK